MSRGGLDSGQFLRNKTSGKWGVSGLDPYGIRGEGEVIITFSTDPTNPDGWLGNGYPATEWEVVAKEQVPPEIREQFRHLVH